MACGRLADMSGLGADLVEQEEVALTMSQGMI